MMDADTAIAEKEAYANGFTTSKERNVKVEAKA